MDTEKCRVLLTAIQEGTLSKAAEKLGYTISGISRSITSLEEESGLKLLYRGRHGIALTSEGKRLLPIMREFMHISEMYDDKIRNIQGLSCGMVTIGVAYVNYFKIITRLIYEFQLKYPNIEVNIIQGTSTELKTALEEHRADFIIASKREGDFSFYSLRKAPMCACVSPNHPAVKKGIYPLHNFKNDKLIAPYYGIETDYAITLKENKITPNVCHITMDLYSAYSMVEAGLGVALLNSLEAQCWDGNVISLPLDPPMDIEIGIMYLGDRMTTSAVKLYEMLLETL